MLRFVNYEFHMCFVPQRRPRATVACNFSSLICPHGSAPTTWRAYFSTLRSHKSLEKKTVFRSFPSFSRTWIFFLLTFSFLIFFILLFSSPPFSFDSLRWLFPSLLFICPQSEVWLLNFLRLDYIYRWNSSIICRMAIKGELNKPMGHLPKRNRAYAKQKILCKIRLADDWDLGRCISIDLI